MGGNPMPGQTAQQPMMNNNPMGGVPQQNGGMNNTDPFSTNIGTEDDIPF
jgi:hypothetical protein